jgi:hypothetical protein
VSGEWKSESKSRKFRSEEIIVRTKINSIIRSTLVVAFIMSQNEL